MSCMCKSAGEAVHTVQSTVLFASSSHYHPECEKESSFMGLLIRFRNVLSSPMSFNFFFPKE